MDDSNIKRCFYCGQILYDKRKFPHCIFPLCYHECKMTKEQNRDFILKAIDEAEKSKQVK